MNDQLLANDTYDVTASGYLRRARARLIEGSKEALFYAAFELRCCVEARQAEYLSHMRAYDHVKVQPYKIGENRRRIAKITNGLLIANAYLIFPSGETFDGYHTPVPQPLVEFCERRLDNLRHSQKEYIPADDNWWDQTRAQLVQNYRLAWVSCQGNLPVPPLWNSKTGEAHPLVIEVREENRSILNVMKNMAGQHFNLRMTYLSEPPADWVCDL